MLQGGAHMKAPKIKYSPDVDILMIQLSDKKIDDSYDAGDAIVQVDENNEPVIVEIFNGQKHLQELGRSVPKKIQDIVWPQNTTVAHQIKKNKPK